MAGVIFSYIDQDNIEQLSDIKGKTFITAKAPHFYSWNTVEHMLAAHQITRTDFSEFQGIDEKVRSIAHITQQASKDADDTQQATQHITETAKYLHTIVSQFKLS